MNATHVMLAAALGPKKKCKSKCGEKKTENQREMRNEVGSGERGVWTFDSFFVFCFVGFLVRFAAFSPRPYLSLFLSPRRPKL